MLSNLKNILVYQHSSAALFGCWFLSCKFKGGGGKMCISGFAYYQHFIQHVCNIAYISKMFLPGDLWVRIPLLLMFSQKVVRIWQVTCTILACYSVFLHLIITQPMFRFTIVFLQMLSILHFFIISRSIFASQGFTLQRNGADRKPLACEDAYL